MKNHSLHSWLPHSNFWRLILAVLAFSRCGQSNKSLEENTNQMVYYDRGTKKAVVYHSAADVPAIHPQTGKPTLVPAMYCEQCEKWLPSPPIEVLERNPKAANAPRGTR